MKYLGSKNRIAKHILPVMLEEAKKHNISKWVEPFVGGGNIIDKVPDSFTKIGSDVNPHTIAALIAVRDHIDKMPKSVSEEEYKALKGTPAEPISSWIRFVCSFSGKFENGYAREKGSDNHTFVELGFKNAQKQSPNLQKVVLTCKDYKHWSFLENTLIYCDPPYKNTTSYKTGAFNHDEFWDWVRKMSGQNNLVFVSEYQAPADFVCVWSGEVKTNLASNRKQGFVATEKLFKWIYYELL